MWLMQHADKNNPPGAATLPGALKVSGRARARANEWFEMNLSRFAADLSAITAGQYVISGAYSRSPSGLFPEL